MKYKSQLMTSVTAISVLFGISAAQAQDINPAASGFSMGVDLNYLTLGHSEGQTEGFGFTLAPEVWAQYQFGNGLAIGLDYFSLDAAGPSTSRYDRIVMQTIDLTASKSVAVGNTLDVRFEGGIRYALYREENASSANYLTTNDSYGILAGLDAKVSLSDSISLVGGGKTSLMFAPILTENGSTTDTDYAYGISEVEFGFQYDKSLNNNSQLFARFSLVGKFWNGVSDDDSENTSAMGANLSLGMSF